MALQSLCWFSRQSFSLSSVKVNRCSKIETVCKKENKIINDDEDNDDNLCRGDSFRTGMPTLLPGSWLKNGPQNLLCLWALLQGKALSSSLKKRKKRKLMHLRKNRKDIPKHWCQERGHMRSGVGVQCHMSSPGATFNTIIGHSTTDNDRSYLYHLR